MNGDMVGTEAQPIDPMLAPIVADGTRMPLNGSPLIGRGDANGAPQSDQQGAPRVGPVDIGAVESPSPWFSTTPLENARFGQTYAYADAASDGAGAPLSITATQIPDWLEFHDNGDGIATLTGTPPDPVAISYPIRLQVNNGSYTIDQSFDLTVDLSRFELNESGILTVLGDIGRDEIQVWVRENQVRAVVNGEVRNFPLSAVAGVVVYGLDDHDVINVNLRSIPAYVLGGGGNDTLNGADEFDTLVGGSGNDSLSGGAGNDELYGMAGHDYLLGGSGNDYINAAEGNDVLIGNAGNDSLYGGAGIDTLYGKDSLFDLLDGGLGDDLATWDAKDALLDAFSTPA
jgi:Ca2+-binding RTX toxin-like protein